MTVSVLFSRSGQLLDILDPANANVFTIVSEHSLVTESVEDRTHNRSARSHEVGQLLLCEAKVLSEAMIAASGEPVPPQLEMEEAFSR
jgi:hypothetical protein